MEALREAARGSPRADRREVHRAAEGLTQEAAPVHGDRRLHEDPHAADRLNGKVERSHRIDAEEDYRMLDGVVIDDTELFNDRLEECEDFYN